MGECQSVFRLANFEVRFGSLVRRKDERYRNAFGINKLSKFPLVPQGSSTAFADLISVSMNDEKDRDVSFSCFSPRFEPISSPRNSCSQSRKIFGGDFDAVQF